jgi:hypothetical protein
MIRFVTMLALGLFVFAGSMSAMVAILRRAPILPYLAISVGTAGILFFSGIPQLEIPGIILSALAVILGTLRAWTTRRRTLSAPTRKVVRLHTGEYLSDSGHWRHAS